MEIMNSEDYREYSPFKRREGFENQLSEINSVIDGANFSELLNDRIYTISYTNQTYRIINHWESKGLIPKVRRNKKGWRKFSLIDLVWLGTIRALRQCGYPLKKIKYGYDQMNEWHLDLSDSSDMPIIEHYIMGFIGYGLGFYCIAFKDGDIDFVDEDEYFVNEWIASKVDHIKISGVPIFNEYFPGDAIKVRSSRWVNLTDEEYKVVGAIRNPDIEEIIIKGKGGKIELLDRIQNMDPRSNIGDILREDDFQDIIIKRTNSKTVTIKRTFKEKFK